MLNKNSIIFNQPLGIYLSSAYLFLVGLLGLASYFSKLEDSSDATELLLLFLSLIEITLAGGLLLRKNWARRGGVLLMFINVFFLFTSIIFFTFAVGMTSSDSDFDMWTIGIIIFLLLFLYISIKILRYLKKEAMVAYFNDKER